MVQRRIELKIHSDPAQLAAVRKTVENFATETGFAEKATSDLGLCIDEMLTNIMRHAYNNQPDRPIELRIEAHDDRLVILIRDWGSGVDPTTLPPRNYDPLTPGGVGMLCIKKLMDEVSFSPQADGMLTMMVKLRT